MSVTSCLRTALIVFVVGVSVVSCSAAGSSGGDGSLTLAIDSEPDCLDPHQSPTEAARLLSRPILDSLVHQNEDGSLSPWLAESWSVSQDLLSYTFILNSDVTFTDGSAFDAPAVVANFDHVVAPTTKSMLASSLIGAYRRATVVDPQTVVVELDRPDSTFLSALATANLGIESPASLSGPIAALCTKIVGTGPYRSDEGLQQQAGIAYQRNAQYHSPPTRTTTSPADNDGPTAIDVSIVPDSAARYGALTSGQVDAIVGVSPNKTRELDALPGFGLHSQDYPGAVFSYWPNTARAPFDDVRVRTAFRLGIDWAQVTKNISADTYSAANNVLSKTTPGYDASVEGEYRFDPAEANRLLDQAGWSTRDSDGIRTKDGQRLRLSHLWSDPSIADLAVQIQGFAKDLGIELVEENLDGGTYVKRLLAGDYDLLDTSFSASGPQVLQVLFGAENIPTEQRGIANNISRYSEPETQQLFAQALAAPDQQLQYQAYAQAQQRIAADAAVFPIHATPATVGAREGLQDIGFDVDGTFAFYRVGSS